MCGIGGWLGRRLGDPGVENRMVKALNHRGPDGHGIKSWPQASLVHTRLSIIDLSEAGHQPMTDDSGELWIAYNGEVYNFQELRDELLSKTSAQLGNGREIKLRLVDAIGPEESGKFTFMKSLPRVYHPRQA